MDPLDLIAIRHPRFSLHTANILRPGGHTLYRPKIVASRDAVTSLSGGGGESGGAEMFLPLPPKTSVPTRSQK